MDYDKAVNTLYDCKNVGFYGLSLQLVIHHDMTPDENAAVEFLGNHGFEVKYVR